MQPSASSTATRKPLFDLVDQGGDSIILSSSLVTSLFKATCHHHAAHRLGWLQIHDVRR
jgi:hypothetical protein